MKLSQIMNTIFSLDTVTVADIRTSEILVDCQVKDNIVESKRYTEELRDLEVSYITVGKELGDLIIFVKEN